MYALTVSLKKILIGKVPLALNLSRCFLFLLPTLDVEIQAVKEEGKNKERDIYNHLDFHLSQLLRL